MGNCQATDAAAAAIQLPDGRVERLYWPTSAEEVMKSHPGYYVALVTFSISGDGAASDVSSGDAPPVRFTRVRLLKHKEMLLIGQVYRLITSQEVTKALRARKQIKKQRQTEKQISAVEEDAGGEDAQISSEKSEQEEKQERGRQRSSRHWRPSLQSISEIIGS